MSNIINIKEERNILTFDSDVFDIVADSTNFYLKFELDEEWAQCSIITVVFDFDGEKCCVELDDERICQIPSTRASKVLFCITAEPDKNSRLSSTILALNVEPSASSFTEDEISYQQSHRNLLGIIENLKTGNGVYAERAKVADASLTQVSLTGDEEIAGVKTFLDRPQIANSAVMTDSEVQNPNIILNPRFMVSQRQTSTTNCTGEDIVCVDRWILSNGTGKFVKGYKKITCTDTENPIILSQWNADTSNQLMGQTLTVSADVDGVRYSKTFTLPEKGTDEYIYNAYVSETGAFRVIFIGKYKRLGVQFVVNPGCEMVIDKVKLEFGEVATKFVERPSAQELILCQHYYQILWIDSIARVFDETRILFSVPVPICPRNIKSTISVKVMPTIYRLDGTSFQPDSIEIDVRRDNMYQFHAICSAPLNPNEIFLITDGKICIDSEVY